MCESRLQSGQIRDADVQASRALLQLTGQVRGGAARLVRSFRVDGDYILELDQSGLVAFRNNPEILEELARSLGGRVWLARASSSNREFIEDLLQPVKVLALGTVWLPDGTKLAKAIVAGRISRRTHSLELVKRIAREVRGIDLVVESDHENQMPKRDAARDSPQHVRSHDAPMASDHSIDTDARPLVIASGGVSQSVSIQHGPSTLAQPGNQPAHTNQSG
ncbi:MAG: hypothetical protein OK474_07360 [Thaumarchaeota archaeon]|nr:hypothetical protein [Nitrososphaerota archaeon]